MNLQEQIITINPSVAAPLYRLLMRDESVAYLRDDKGIIGFELLNDSPLMSGFALIGLRKRTILAYRSEDKSPRLVLFPSIEKLFNESYQLLALKAQKKHFSSDRFRGQLIDSGIMSDLVRDLTPPERNIGIPSHLTEQMIRIMLSEHSDQEENDDTPARGSLERFRPLPGQEDQSPAPETNTAPTNPYFDSANHEDTSEEEPESAPLSPDQVVLNERFDSEHTIIYFVANRFGVEESLLKKLLNALLMQTQGMKKRERVFQFQQLVAKLLKEKPQVIKK